MRGTLIKTDKNGTEYYADYTCPRCGGQGGCDAWAYTGWTCYECGGTGKTMKPMIRKIYTPEYAAKLAERRHARAVAKAPEVNANFFKKFGMNEEGKAWLVIGNTFQIKDELKEAGARYNDFIGWHFDHEVSEYPCCEISIEDIAEKDDVGVWNLFDAWWVNKITKELRDANAPKTDSEYVGEIGQKLELKVKYLRYFTFETHFSYYGEMNFIYKFADENGNTIVWKTSKCLCDELQQENYYTIKGTVKEQNEYKGDKQTVLTRCKISEAA